MNGTLETRKLKITPFAHFAALLSLIIVSSMFFIVLVFLKFDSDAILVFSAFLLIDAAPTLYLHFDYWAKNRGEEYELGEKQIIGRKGEEELCYNYSDVEKVIVYLSPSLFRNSNFHLLAIESYHYAVVRLRTGEELILTCLLAPRLDKSLRKMRNVLFEKRKKLFCMIP